MVRLKDICTIDSLQLTGFEYAILSNYVYWDKLNPKSHHVAPEIVEMAQQQDRKLVDFFAADSKFLINKIAKCNVISFLVWSFGVILVELVGMHHVDYNTNLMWPSDLPGAAELNSTFHNVTKRQPIHRPTSKEILNSLKPLTEPAKD